MLGQEQRGVGVVRVLAADTLHAAAGLGPVRVDVAQVVVELQADLPLRGLAAQRTAIDFGGLRALVALDQQAGLIEQLLVGRIGQADVLLQQQGLARQRLDGLQALQVASGAGQVAVLDRDEAQAIERIRLRRIDQQQFLPDLAGALGLILRLPEMPLLNQQALGIAALGLGAAMGQGGEQRQSQRAVAEHGDSQSGSRRPSAAKR